MSRIRSIHPGIWTDEAFMEASPVARLLLFGLWNEAWDDGVFEWKPLTIKARIFPVDVLDVAALLGELERLSFVCRFKANGKEYGAIRNFQKYQRPKKPNSSGVLPNSLCSWVKSSEPVPNQYGTSGEEPAQMEDGEGIGEGEKKEAAATPAKSFLVECRDLVGEEPVLLAQDFAVIERLLEGGDVTRDDVFSGIRAAMAKPGFRIKSWSQLEGWARGSARERLAGKSKAVLGKPVLVPTTPEERDAALARQGKRWVPYDTAEWVRVAELWKSDKGTYPPHPSGGWYFPESYFPAAGAAA
jgi:hypothetical protein